MTVKLNKETFEALIAEDIKFMEGAPNTLERAHIITILRYSVDLFYPDTTPMVDLGNMDIDGAKRMIAECRDTLTIES